MLKPTKDNPMCFTCERLHDPGEPCARKIAKALLGHKRSVASLFREEREVMDRFLSGYSLLDTLEEIIVDRMDFYLEDLRLG